MVELTKLCVLLANLIYLLNARRQRIASQCSNCREPASQDCTSLVEHTRCLINNCGRRVRKNHIIYHKARLRQCRREAERDRVRDKGYDYEDCRECEEPTTTDCNVLNDHLLCLAAHCGDLHKKREAEKHMKQIVECANKMNRGKREVHDHNHLACDKCSEPLDESNCEALMAHIDCEKANCDNETFRSFEEHHKNQIQACEKKIEERNKRENPDDDANCSKCAEPEKDVECKVMMAHVECVQTKCGGKKRDEELLRHKAQIDACWKAN